MAAVLHLKKDRERSVLGRHPWLFSGAVQRTEGAPKEGDLVEVRSSSGKFLGRGFFGDRSISAKILAFDDRPIDAAFYKDRLKSAFAVRAAIGLTSRSDLNCYRLVHGEGDGLAGLVVDRFADIASIELHSSGHAPYLEQISEAIVSVCPEVSTVISKGAVSNGSISNDAGSDGVVSIRGESRPSVDVVELGVKLRIPVSGGQKTGYFLDQRTNRELVASFAKGRAVLDLFSYIGGFGLHAAVAGASHVEAVDGSRSAVEAIAVNAEINNVKINAILSDCFEYLKSSSERFDIVVVDPPAFVKHRAALQSGIRGYQTLNQAAIRRVAPGGLMVTCSCSQLVTEEDFFIAVRTAAGISGRNVRVLKRLGQAECHPTSIFHAEARYLKGLLLQVE